MLLLLTFVGAYVALSAWSVRVALRAFHDAATGGKGAFFGYLYSAAAALVAAFLIKGLFAIRRGAPDDLIELNQEREPRLFDFIHRLADQIGAPRPHRVFVSNRVNAAVFYDLSLLNLIVPSRKNLEIGLGLVNSLTLSELKAVLAHEFGHFAQRSMAIGRWVYTTRQLAAHIVAKRDALDRFLSWASAIDLRVSWVAWGFRLLIWSLRSLVDATFRLVLLAERALAREMEFHADLVSVSVTGSDALINALHRLHGADEAWERSVQLIEVVRTRGGAPSDAFAVHGEVLARLRTILNEPELGATPKVAPRERVFKETLVQPPRMWATHPDNGARELNAKRRYVPAPLDDRDAWCLFSSSEQLRREATTRLLQSLAPDQKSSETDDAKMKAVLDAHFGLVALDPRYQGVYLERLCVRDVARPGELLAAIDAKNDLLIQLDGLYPSTLRQDVSRWQALEEERVMLEAYRDGHATAQGGAVNYRGRTLKRSQVGPALRRLGEDIRGARARVVDHDRRCRSVHAELAKVLGSGWAAYHASLVGLLHYATHAGADLADAMGHFQNVLAVVTADGKVSSRERKRLVAAAGELFQALGAVYGYQNDVFVPEVITRELGVQSWSELFGEPLGLASPDEQNIGDWLQVMPGWYDKASGALAALRGEALDELLRCEKYLAARFRSGGAVDAAPRPAAVPGSYTVLIPGKERERQRTLGWWDRFQTADGFVPGLARFAVAASILGLVLGFTSQHTTNITVYNGLGADVRVTLADQTLELLPLASRSVQLEGTDALEIRTTTLDGQEVETFQAKADNALAEYVYNVAGAAPLTTWTVHYGKDGAPNPQISAARWSQTDADYIFVDPPQTVKTKGSTSRRVLSAAPGDLKPSELLDLVPQNERASLALAHARFDPADSAQGAAWRQLADGLVSLRSGSE